MAFLPGRSLAPSLLVPLALGASLGSSLSCEGDEARPVVARRRERWQIRRLVLGEQGRGPNCVP